MRKKVKKVRLGDLAPNDVFTIETLEFGVVECRVLNQDPQWGTTSVGVIDHEDEIGRTDEGFDYELVPDYYQDLDENTEVVLISEARSSA